MSNKTSGAGKKVNRPRIVFHSSMWLSASSQEYFTKEALTNIAETTLHNIQDYFDGKPLINEICYHCSDTGCRKQSEGRCF